MISQSEITESDIREHCDHMEKNCTVIISVKFAIALIEHEI